MGFHSFNFSGEPNAKKNVELSAWKIIEHDKYGFTKIIPSGMDANTNGMKKFNSKIYRSSTIDTVIDDL